jgi:hypothetical protein
MVLPIELYDKISFLLDTQRANMLSPYYRKKIVSFARKHSVVFTDTDDFIDLCSDLQEDLIIKLFWFCNDDYQRERVLSSLIYYRDVDSIKSLLALTHKFNPFFIKKRIEEAIDKGDTEYFQILSQYVTLSRSELMYLHDLCLDEYFELKDILIEKLQM